MNTIILYSTGCPKCNVLKKKMAAKNVKFTEVTDPKEMESLGIDAVPVLRVDDTFLTYVEAVKYINKM